MATWVTRNASTRAAQSLYIVNLQTIKKVVYFSRISERQKVGL